MVLAKTIPVNILLALETGKLGSKRCWGGKICGQNIDQCLGVFQSGAWGSPFVDGDEESSIFLRVR